MREALSLTNFRHEMEGLLFNRFISVSIRWLIVSMIYQRQVYLTLEFLVPASSHDDPDKHIKIHFILAASEFLLHPDDWASHFWAYQPFVNVEGILLPKVC